MLGQRAPVLSARMAVALVVVVALVVAGSGCAKRSNGAHGGLRVVSAENMWGSIASQLLGTKGEVQSIITSPAQDPHSYEPRAGDARALAEAQLVVINGIDYDPWAQRLLASNPSAGRVVLTIGDLLRLRSGDNPHVWYDANDVSRVAGAITQDLKRLDPADSAYFERRLASFQGSGLAQYHALIRAIRTRYHATPVGASESIFQLQSRTLGLRLLTPEHLMKAVSEGTDVTAQDAASAERQITSHQIKVWVYNNQNVDPEVKRLNGLARAANIPIVTITETLAPANATFQQWQVGQLRALAAALRQATGR